MPDWKDVRHAKFILTTQNVDRPGHIVNCRSGKIGHLPSLESLRTSSYEKREGGEKGRKKEEIFRLFPSCLPLYVRTYVLVVRRSIPRDWTEEEQKQQIVVVVVVAAAAVLF